MSKILLLFVFLIHSTSWAQYEPDPLDKYAPPGIICTSLKEALNNSKTANKLKLENQTLDPKLLPKIGKLKETYAIQLVNNNLTELPPEFIELSNLIYFASSGNAFTALPKGFGKLDQLTELHLHYTNIDSLPYDIAYLNRLKVVDIQNNQSEKFAFPNTMGELPNLNELLLYNVKLDTLPDSFSKFKRLKELTFVKCSIDSIPKQIGTIVPLEHLVLDNNNIALFPASIFKLKNLKTLSLRGNKLTHISDQICFMKNLEVLDLRDNYIKDFDISVLKVLLPKCRILY